MKRFFDFDTYSSIAEKSADTKIYPASMTFVKFAETSN